MTIHVDDELLVQMKAQAATVGVTLAHLIADALRASLVHREHVAQRGRGRLLTMQETGTRPGALAPQRVSLSLRRPEDAFPTVLWHNSVCNFYTHMAVENMRRLGGCPRINAYSLLIANSGYDPCERNTFPAEIGSISSRNVQFT